ncbi:MAG: histidine phosphatase family protein [Bacilli bacterium]
MQDADVYFIRHAVTEENLRYTLIGRSNPPLHPLGQTQAAAAAAALRTIEFDAIYTSPLQRAHDTAVAIARAQRTSPAVVDVPDLRELDLGILDGVSSFTAYEQHRELMDQALSMEAPDEFSLPEGERRADALQRFHGALQTLAAAAAGPLCIVTHGGVLGLWLARLHSQPLARFREWQPPHASITRARVRSDGGADVQQRGDMSHVPASLAADIARARDARHR